jgi:S-adenosylmethionine:tRNA ribosyltransferase-isomerase
MTDERVVGAYDFDLPEDLIAQRPAAQRDASRLMVLGRDAVEHRIFHDLPDVLRDGDVLVLNDTRVIAARLYGTLPTGGRVEVLLLRPADRERYDPSSTRWHALVKPGKKLREGARVTFERDGTILARARVAAVLPEDGVRELDFDLHVPFEELLARAGVLPLPPYIHNDSVQAQERYQTVFARTPGSVAAPTASLHFTPALLEELQRRGVEIVYLTLDVGLGTFRPMQSERLEGHLMHAESYAIGRDTVEAIERAQRAGRRVVGAGTTVVRALEGNVLAHGRLTAGAESTNCFITPGFRFAVVDAMITNFHLPKSTLLVLVSAFAGRERILRAYREAIDRKYRFFSFGDAMLLERVSDASPVENRNYRASGDSEEA